MPVVGLHVSKAGVCTARLWGSMVRLARAHIGVFLVIFADCRKTEDTSLVTESAGQMHLTSEKSSKRCRDVRLWYLWMGVGCLKTSFGVVWRDACPSITFSVLFFLQYKTGLFFWLGSNAEKVTSIISEPLGGYNMHVIHVVSQECWCLA